MGAVVTAINPSAEHAKAQYQVELNQSIEVDLQNQVAEWLALDNDMARARAAELKTDLAITKSLMGFWRNEAQFWKNEIDENKKDIAATNKLAASS